MLYTTGQASQFGKVGGRILSEKPSSTKAKVHKFGRSTEDLISATYGPRGFCMLFDVIIKDKSYITSTYSLACHLV